MPVEIETLYLLATLVIFTAASPGPDVLYIVSNSLSGTWRIGLSAWMGIFLGILLYVFATALGLSLLFSIFPALYVVVKWLGIAYLAYMALNFLKSALFPAQDIEIGARADKSLPKIFFSGLAVTLLNPKTVLFFTAFLPQFVNIHAGQVSLQLLILGLAATMVGQTVYACYVACFVLLGKKIKGRADFRRTSRHVRILDGICGVLYAGFSIGLAMWKRA